MFGKKKNCFEEEKNIPFLIKKSIYLPITFNFFLISFWPRSYLFNNENKNFNKNQIWVSLLIYWIPNLDINFYAFLEWSVKKQTFTGKTIIAYTNKNWREKRMDKISKNTKTNSKSGWITLLYKYHNMYNLFNLYLVGSIQHFPKYKTFLKTFMKHKNSFN